MATQALVQAAPEPATAVAGRFVDITAKARVNFQSQTSRITKKYLPETMDSGGALFDYDNDGLLHIFFVNGAPPLSDPMSKGTIPEKSGPQYWNRLPRQKKDGTFEDVAARVGLVVGAALIGSYRC